MTTYDLEGKEGYVAITNWHKRQFKSDDVAERVRNWRERNVTETPQIEREGGNVSPSKTFPPPQYDGSDLERATQEATPSQSPNEIKHSQSHVEEKNEVFTEDNIIEMAHEVSEKYDYPEALEDVREEIANGASLKSVWFAIMHVLNFYEPKGALTPRMDFRKELNSRINT
jgi:hypothetical protein